MHIHLQNGKETTVSLWDPAPAGLVQNYSPEIQDCDLSTQKYEMLDKEQKIPSSNKTESITIAPVNELINPLRRSERSRKPHDHLIYE